MPQTNPTEGGTTKATQISVNSAYRRVNPREVELGDVFLLISQNRGKQDTGRKTAAVLFKPIPWTLRFPESGSALTLNFSVTFGGLAGEKKQVQTEVGNVK